MTALARPCLWVKRIAFYYFKTPPPRMSIEPWMPFWLLISCPSPLSHLFPPSPTSCEFQCIDIFFPYYRVGTDLSGWSDFVSGRPSSTLPAGWSNFAFIRLLLFTASATSPLR